MNAKILDPRGPRGKRTSKTIRRFLSAVGLLPGAAARSADRRDPGKPCERIPVWDGKLGAFRDVDPESAERLAKIPTWVFHGDADERVPVERSREMVEAVRQAGGDVRFTEYPGVAHNCWDRAYADPELYRWLFKQRSKPSGTRSAADSGRESPP